MRHDLVVENAENGLACSLVDELRLSVPQPFSSKLTLWKPTHFPTQLEIHSLNTSWRTFRVLGLPCGVRFTGLKGGLYACVFSTSAWTRAHSSSLQARLRRSYGLDEDLSAFYEMASRDPVLAQATQRLLGMRSSCPETFFEMAILCVVLQNTTVKRSRQMLSALLRLYGESIAFDGVTLLVFFEAGRLSEVPPSELREKARVGYRDKVISAIAGWFSQLGAKDDLAGLEESEVVDALCQIRGVGPYTARTVTASALRDPSAFGLDVWNRKILGHLLLDDEEAPAEAVDAECRRRFGDLAGRAVEYLIESEHISDPVCPIYATDEEARAASRSWPRPPHLSTVNLEECNQ